MIFLHSSFRVSGTWVWSRFRSIDRINAYYEVFNEQLGGITRAQLPHITPECWLSKHPPGPPYFLEFLPLVKRQGGVEKYHPAMAFDRFLPEGGIDGSISAAEGDYLCNLIAHAERLGKIPLLSFKRGLGRMRAIKSAFPGFHILVYRNLFHQWCSYTGQYRRGSTSFFDAIRKTIEAGRQDPFFGYLRAHFPLDQPAIDSSDYFYCFVLLHLYLYARVFEAADLVIDVNRIAADAAYRRAIETRIAAATGVAVDLAGTETSMVFSFARLGNVEETVHELRMLGDTAITGVGSAKGREFAFKCLTDFIEDYARYDFYAGALAAECHRLSVEGDPAIGGRHRLHERGSGQGEVEDIRSVARRLAAPVRALASLFG